MGELSNDKLRLSILAALSMATAVPALADSANPSASTPAPTSGQSSSNDADTLDQIVVTASTGDKTQLRSSLQVTDISSELVQDMAPRSTAETLKLIPGMSVTDMAGGGGNANFSVRGLPVTTGGAPFVQLQEDGLPQVLFGDMNFGNNDYWTRFDVSNTIEATVGGSAATLAAGAPGAVINYISDTGIKQAGVFTLSEGVGFNESKATFAVGGPISDTWRYHMDGFYVYGTGLRDQGSIGENGYQIKANLTHDLSDDKGYIRFYVKLLDDQEEYNAGGPVNAVGSSNTLSSISPYPGNDIRTGTTVGIYNQSISYLNSTTGTFAQVPNDGVHPVVHSFGAELHFTPAGDLAIDNKFRLTQMSGNFAAQFFGLSNTASVIGTTVNGQKVGSVVYGAGPNAGQAYSGLTDSSAQIYTNMSDMGSVVNDFALSDKWIIGANKLSARAGLFYMNQTIDQNWHPNVSLATVSGSNPAPLNLISSSGQLLSNAGISGYNTNWGAGNDRTYAMNVADTAPYLDLTWDLDALQLEGSLRRDDYRVTGWAESASAATTNIGYLSGGTFSPTGSLTTPLVSYMTLDPSTYEPLNYGLSYNSWSAGALYQFGSDTSVYARASRGGKANTDRNILSGYTNPDGSLNQSGQNQAVDIVLQQEVGIKHKGQILDGSYNFTAAYFQTSFGESSYDLTKPAADRYFDDKYSAKGIELNGTLRFGGFTLYAQATFQNPTVDANEVGSSPSTLVSGGTGYLPGGTAKVMYAIVPSYTWGPVSGGFVVQGQSQENINGYPPYYSPANTFVDLFAMYRITDAVSVGVHANNLFNTLGLGGGGSVTTGPGVIGASAEPGRTVLADVTVKF
ncbi:MAG: TonB-dependent receptor [Steroidobacteraceae bacterium]|jgi:outer membrane receptor protein involved in Fe transport